LIIGTFLLFLCNWALALSSGEDKALADKVDYLVRLGEQNISWANILNQVNVGFITVIGFAFISIIIYIFIQIRQMQNEHKLSREAEERISNHEVAINKIKYDIERIKDQIRDASLATREKKISDDDIAKFIKEEMKVTPTINYVNFLKDLMWKENISLEQIKPAIEDIDLRKKVKDAYQKAFPENLWGLDDLEAIEWVYQIKTKGLTIEDLLNKEIEFEKRSMELYRQMVSYRLFHSSKGR